MQLLESSKDRGSLGLELLDLLLVLLQLALLLLDHALNVGLQPTDLLLVSLLRDFLGLSLSCEGPVQCFGFLVFVCKLRLEFLPDARLDSGKVHVDGDGSDCRGLGPRKGGSSASGAIGKGALLAGVVGPIRGGSGGGFGV